MLCLKGMATTTWLLSLPLAYASPINDSRTNAIANLYYDFEPAPKVSVSGVALTSELEPPWGGFGLGSTYNWGNDKYALYGEATVNTTLGNFGNNYALTGRMGFNIRF